MAWGRRRNDPPEPFSRDEQADTLVKMLAAVVAVVVMLLVAAVAWLVIGQGRLLHKMTTERTAGRLTSCATINGLARSENELIDVIAGILKGSQRATPEQERQLRRLGFPSQEARDKQAEALAARVAARKILLLNCPRYAEEPYPLGVPAERQDPQKKDTKRGRFGPR